MSAYRHAIVVAAGDSGERLAAAAAALADGTGVVLFDGRIALRPLHDLIRCEVLDPAPSERRCAHEYEVLVENARHALDASGFRRLMPRRPLEWRVVEDRGTGVGELWPCQ